MTTNQQTLNGYCLFTPGFLNVFQMAFYKKIKKFNVNSWMVKIIKLEEACSNVENDY